MGSSRKTTEKRSVFDVHVSGKNRLKNVWDKISGAKTLNLRPKFRVRHPWVTVAATLVIVMLVLLGARRLFTRAEVSDFYPSSCLGTWQNSANAEGSPENLSLGFASSTFNASNSAVFVESSMQIYCGGFLPPDFKPTGNITRVGITFLWNVAGGSTGLSSASASAEATSSPETPPSTAPLPLDTSAPTSTSTPNTNSSTTTSFLFNFWQPILTAFAEDTSTPSTDTTTTATAISLPAIETATTMVATTSATSMAAGDAGSSTPIILGPPISADLSPLATTTASTTTTTTESIAASSTLPAPPPSPPPPDQNFLEVSYSTDGTNWISLAKVGPTNWQNFTISLPVTKWDDIKKLQIRIGGIPTSLTKLPSVLLDGMFVEAQYEIPPIAVGGSDSGISPQPTQNAAVPAPAVIVLPPQNAPLPAGGDANFKADEAPSFDLDLGNLPVPISTTTTTTAPIPPAPPPPVSAPTSSPTGLLRNASHALASALRFFLRTLSWGDSASAQTTNTPGAGLPTSDNPVVAKILDPENHVTNLQPTFVFMGNTVRILLPKPGREFKPGAYSLKLWVWRNGAVYHSENMFSWGVLAVNFNKSIYTLGDKAKIGFGVLDDGGHTICDADIDMNVASPSGKVSHFETQNGTIARSSSCGSATVTNNPDYTASLIVSEPGTYTVSVTAKTANGVRQISDKFEAQNPPLFDVERFGPTRIYPPATYNVSITVKANADFSGNVTETAPASFNIAPAVGGQKTSAGDTQIISWPVNLKRGDAATLSYSFKAPDVSPELYKLGPLQIGSWQEARQWQIAADANTVIFITSLASSTWTVPSDWNNASNTIEVIGGGGGGMNGISNAAPGGGGGGGGAYAKISNLSLTPGASVNIDVGGGGGVGASGTITYFNWNGSGSSSTCNGTTMSACADFGSPAVAGTGGVGGATSSNQSVGTTLFAGGNGGNGGSAVKGLGGGGGGGAAGPLGNGGAGGNDTASAAPGGGGGGGGNGGGSAASSTTSSTGGNGGTNSSGTGGGTGGSGAAGGNGSSGGGGGGGAGRTSANPAYVGGNGSIGTEWDATHGSGGGSGGGGGNSRTSGGGGGAGGTAGSYGSGGGGGGSCSASGCTVGAGKAGAQGIIVITYTPAATGPTVSNVVLNNNAAIILNPNATATISVAASTTAGANPILYATSTIYRSGVGATCTDNNLNCYQLASSSCSFSGATTTVTCSANIWYFAQATDASSSFPAQNWQAAITVTDSAAGTNTSSTAAGVALNTLLAINVTTSSINYGTLVPGTNTGSTNQVATTTNAGNASTTLKLSGTALTLGSNVIATSSQHYATSTFTFGGAEQVLSDTPTAVSGFLLTSPTSTTAVAKSTFWGITVPTGSATGTYSGTNTFTAVFSP